MAEKAIDNKRIIKNTLILYFRMLLVMLVSLYTVRIVLHVLGEVDYGIYNVVGGIVIMFSFFSKTLASASQRYFAFELGKGDKLQLNRVFNLTLLLYFFSIVFIVVLAETLGLWFFYNKMTIPDERMRAAFWIYQFSIISFCYTLIATPYQAIIIAHENMTIYAIVGILEAVLSLTLALLLPIIPYDYLIAYGAMMLFNTVISNSIYIIFSRKYSNEVKLNYYFDKTLAKELVSYSGWNLYGATANVFRSQGINILINMFFSPVINAARGIAYQINGALSSFASNFYTAVRPQVTKSYAKGENQEMLSLVFSSSKYSFFLIAFLAFPVMVFAHEVLQIWLIEIPDSTVLFTRLVVIIAMIESLSNPLMTLAQATGKVKLYQCVIGTLLILNLPFSWCFLKLGYPAECTMYVAMAIAVFSLFARLFILKKIALFPIKEYCSSILTRILIVSFLCYFATFTIRLTVYEWCMSLLSNHSFTNVISLFIALAASILVTCVIIYCVGLSKLEKKQVLTYAINCFKKSTARK